MSGCSDADSGDILISVVPPLAVDWGPVSAWAAAAATVVVVIVTVLVALGYFDRVRGPRLHLTFEATEPWCRRGKVNAAAEGLWIRVGVENLGTSPARGCVGRLIDVQTGDELRPDVDPVQLRWAGLPRSQAFKPVDIRRDQREYLNVLYLRDGNRWRLVTFEDQDFDPGFATELPLDQAHRLRISVFADNAQTATRWLVANATGGGADSIVLRLED
jgi:hypothetical protein